MSDINALYEWINKRYEQYINGDIAEEVYLKDLDFYKQKLAESEENIEPFVETEDIDKSKLEAEEKINPNKVRSTSIAGLRKKLLEEMGKK